MGRESRFALIHGLSLTSACAGEIEDKKLARRKDDKELRQANIPMSLGEFLHLVHAENHDLVHLEQLCTALT